MTVSDRVAPPIDSLSTAARVAGSTIAFAFLLGLVPGPLVSVVGGLALVTLGRAWLLPEIGARRAGLSLAVLAGALGVGALRWGTLDLPELRGVQAVLGPTVLVGPDAAAIACAVAFVGGLVGLAAGLLEPHPSTRADYVWGAIEIGLGSLALVTIFAVPASSVLQGAGFGPALLEIARWVAAVAVAVAIVFGLSILLEKMSDRWRWLALGCGGLAVAGAAATVSVVL